MPTFGGVSPSPRRFGGGNQRLQRILESLNKGRGSGYDTTPTSSVYVENMATARTIDGMWGVAERLSNQFDPFRISTLLSRWERILGLSPKAGDSSAARRARIVALRARFGQLAGISYLNTLLSAALGPLFVVVETISPSIATSYWPGGATSPYTPWYSTVAHMLIRTQLPAGWSEGAYQAAISNALPALEGLLPAWVTINTYRPGPSNYAVTGGPTAAGLYLDTPLNLDNAILGT